MKLLGTARVIAREELWRLDCDYLAKLSPSEREYIERFLAEHYLGAGLRSEDALHKSDAERRAIHERRHSARRDIVTAAQGEIARACASAPDGNLRKRGSYMPSDYTQAEGSPEETLVNALDSTEDT